MTPYLWVMVGALVLGGLAGHILKRIRGRGFTTKQQMKFLGVFMTAYLLVMIAAALINSGKLALP